MKEFSVLMPVYAGERPEHFSAALSSVILQLSKPSQIVIVKDGPLTDSLETVLDSFLRQEPGLFTIVPLAARQGICAALQTGLSACRYDLVARMDSDDISAYTRFKKELALFENDSKLDIVGSYISEFKEDPKLCECIKKVPVTNEEIYSFASTRCPFNHPSVMFRKNAILACGGYIDLYGFEDYYLWERLLASGAHAANIPEALVYMRTGSGMYGRRGGFDYCKRMVKFLYRMFRQKNIGFFHFLVGCCAHVFLGSLPKRPRTFIYQSLLREKPTEEEKNEFLSNFSNQV